MKGVVNPFSSSPAAPVTGASVGSGVLLSLLLVSCCPGLNKSTARFGVKIKNDESFILNVYARASSSAFDPVSSR